MFYGGGYGRRRGGCGRRYGGYGYGHRGYAYGGGGGSVLPALMGGMMIASATQPRYHRPQQTVVYTQPSQTVDYQARADAEAARRAAEEALTMQQQQQYALDNNLTLAKTRIPAGIKPGQSFVFKLDGRQLRVKCPSNLAGGQEMSVYVPLLQAEEVTNAHSAPEVGREMLQAAFGPSTDQRANVYAILVQDQVMNESSVDSMEHNIVSGRKNDIVEIIAGSLDRGLPSPYQDYCLVQFADGKIGKVSRFLLQPYRSPKVIR